MRKLEMRSENTDMDISTWGTVYVNNRSLADIIAENIESGNFRAKITIIIEEQSPELVITSNKQKLELEEDEEYELEDDVDKPEF